VKVAELTRERDAASAKLAEATARMAELGRERDAANAKAAEASRAFVEMQAKLDDIEGEAQTLRRPQQPGFREPVVVTGEVQSNMVARMTRLEATATAEKQAAQDAKRDADESKRAASESKRASELVVAQRDAAIARAEKLEKGLAEERAGRKDLVAAKAALESEVIGLKKRIEAILVDREAEAAPEVSHLEAALRDRGHKIAGLERDLRESERIGRELISEIEALHPTNGGGDGGGGGGGGALNGQGGSRDNGMKAQPGAQAASARPSARPGAVDALTADAFQHRIDALAADAAQKQAELLSSTWRIQALERELGEARGTAGDPSRQQRELSTALVRAQSEIADLRRALSVRGDAGAVPRA
jgi:colicin import membrane protein